MSVYIIMAFGDFFFLLLEDGDPFCAPLRDIPLDGFNHLYNLGIYLILNLKIPDDNAGNHILKLLPAMIITNKFLFGQRTGNLV